MAFDAVVRWLVHEENRVVPTLFKPVQFSIIKKLHAAKPLTENEKRYLRGKMREKLVLLQKALRTQHSEEELGILLGSIGSYYITGLEALKHNGYGWYYTPKIVEIITTKIEGKMTLGNQTLRFIRVKSIAKSKIIVDKKTGVRYATNEQVLKDIVHTRNTYTKSVWLNMYTQYKDIFAKGMKKIKEIIPEYKPIDYSQYGV